MSRADELPQADLDFELEAKAKAIIRKLEAARDNLADWRAGATAAAVISNAPRSGPHTEAAYSAHKTAYETGPEQYRLGADVVAAAVLDVWSRLEDERDQALARVRELEARVRELRKERANNIEESIAEGMDVGRGEREALRVRVRKLEEAIASHLTACSNSYGDCDDEACTYCALERLVNP